MVDRGFQHPVRVAHTTLEKNLLSIQEQETRIGTTRNVSEAIIGLEEDPTDTYNSIALKGTNRTLTG